MNCRFARSPFMEQQQNRPPQGQDPQNQSPVNRAGPLVEPNVHPDQGQDGSYSAQNPIPAAEHWDSRPASRPLLLLIAVVGVIAVLVFALSMCTSSVNTAAVDNRNGAAPAQILQRNVNGAFSTDGETAAAPAQTPATTAPQPQTETAPPAAAATQEEQVQQQMQDLQKQQELQEQQERLLQEQRDAIPSVLPENPPAPATLGPY